MKMKVSASHLPIFLARIILSGMMWIALSALVPSISAAIQSPDVTLKLNALINQAESTYLKPMGMDFDTALNQYPDALATAMGLALQRQMQYVNEGAVPIYPYSRLRQQATEYLQEIARRHNYRHPTSGISMGKDYMQEKLMDNAAGFFNEAFFKKYGINPSAIDLPLIIGDKPAQNSVQDLAKFHQKQDDDAITLFGQKMKAADGPDMPAPAPSPPLAPQVQRRKVVPDSIIGGWEKNSYGTKRYPQHLTIRKGYGKALYEGRSANGRETVIITEIEKVSTYEVNYKGYLKTDNKNYTKYCNPNWLISFKVKDPHKDGIIYFYIGKCGGAGGLIGSPYKSTGQ
jgi:hypothetical protein